MLSFLRPALVMPSSHTNKIVTRSGTVLTVTLLESDRKLSDYAPKVGHLSHVPKVIDTN